jgi:hypothetical protein
MAMTEASRSARNQSNIRGRPRLKSPGAHFSFRQKKQQQMRQRTGPSAKFSHVYPIDSEIETGENFSTRCRIVPYDKIDNDDAVCLANSIDIVQNDYRD